MITTQKIPIEVTQKKKRKKSKNINTKKLTKHKGRQQERIRGTKELEVRKQLTK